MSTKISLKAVLAGGVTDIVLSTLLGIPFGIYVVASRDLVNAADPGPAVEAAILHDGDLFMMQLLIGFGCSVIGGHVAARLAKGHELLNGVLASWLCIGLGVLMFMQHESLMRPVTQLVCIAATPLAYLFGAWLQLRRIQTPPATEPS